MFQELNTVTKDGKTVLEESATDKDCRAQVMKAKFDDDTVNTIINDLDGVCQKQRDLFLSVCLCVSVCYPQPKAHRTLRVQGSVFERRVSGDTRFCCSAR